MPRIGLDGEVARVVEIAQFAIVAGIEAVLLIAEKFAAELQQVTAMLPGEVVRISKDVVDENFRGRVGAETGWIAGALDCLLLSFR